MDESDGNEYLLVFHQCIFLGKDMKHTLVNPNQLRDCGLVVHDCPRQFDRNSKHSIIVPTHNIYHLMTVVAIHLAWLYKV